MRRSVTLAEDSPESSEEDTETEDEPRKTRMKESVEEWEARERKAAVKALAIAKPTPWNGKAIYENFDRWVDQVTDWRRNHNLSEFAVIATMGFLLEGAAKDWYKTAVRDKEREWTLETLNSALFTEMFPPDIDSILRDEFMSSEQGNRSLINWHKYVIKLASRVPNLSDHDVRRQFMVGANDWLTEKWTEYGYNPENPNVKMRTLMDYGQRFERARTLLIRERQAMESESEGPVSSDDWNEDQESQTDQDGSGDQDPLTDQDEAGSQESETDQYESTSQEEGDGGYQERGQDADERQDPSSSSGESTNLEQGLTAKEKAK